MEGSAEQASEGVLREAPQDAIGPTLALTISLPDVLREPLTAELAEMGFEAFQEISSGLAAYGPLSLWSDEARSDLVRWLAEREVPLVLEESVIAPENWNRRWEASVTPVSAGPFVIAPTWAEVPPEHAGKTLLRIDPKMSFGTGHHASTRLAVRLLSDVVQGGEAVLDVGTGTGVLAVAAVLLGAREALGIDIDPWSLTNAEETAALNGVSDEFTVQGGSVEVAGDGVYDLVLANLIQHHLLPLLPALAARTALSGCLVLSGLLVSERGPMMQALRAESLAVVSEATEGEWWACVTSPR